MLRISRARGAGKTTEIVKWLLDDDKRILIVQHEQSRRDIIQRFNVPQIRVITMHDLEYKICGLQPSTEFGVDEIEGITKKNFDLISHLYKLGAYTHTNL